LTINKSQCQSLSRIRLYLPRTIFTHEQLYVVISRVKTKKSLKILILDEDGNLTNTTKNVVYKKKLPKVSNKDETIGMSLLIYRSFSNLFHYLMIYLLSEINYNDHKCISY